MNHADFSYLVPEHVDFSDKNFKKNKKMIKQMILLVKFSTIQGFFLSFLK